ncbi:MAG TPA: SprT family zinc-dependent metalloprotease [Patescibacteria group bacterium]|nr:SprT family zinc-dependent metalloprotease [Patescibacteria group bacterium]
MATKQVDIPGIGPVTLYKRHGNRSLRLSLAPDGEVRVSLPYWVPYAAGEQFARSRSAWINEHRLPEPAQLAHELRVGKAHRLHFTPLRDATKAGTRIKMNMVEVTYPVSWSVDDPRVQKAAHGAAIRAMRKEARQILPLRLKQLAEREGFSYTSVDIRQLKSRWGSCSSKQEIVLNLFLMQLPWHLIDYVLLHELTHTRVMQHGAPFWQEMERHVPHAKRLRKEIGTHHPVLSTGV